MTTRGFKTRRSTRRVGDVTIITESAVDGMIDAVLDAFEEDVFPPEIERFRSSYSATAPRLTGELASGLDKTETDRDERRKTVTTRTGSQVEHAAFVEYGTERTAAQPFGRSAWRRTRRSTDRAVDKQVTKRIRDR